MRHLRLVFSGLLVILALMMTTGVFAQEAIAVGDTVEGTRTDADIDYAIELEAGQLILVSVVAADFDSNVAVLNTSGEQLGYDDDSAGERNPYLAFFVPETGSYVIRVGAFFGEGSGAFTLTVALGEVTPLTVSTPLDVQFNGAPQFFSFEGAEGDVVTVSATNDNYVSVDLALVGPDGLEVSNNSSLFIGNRQLRRVILPLSGLYSLKLSSYSISEVAETVVLTVTPDTILSLDGGSVNVVIEQDVIDFDVVRFTATAGTTYVLSAVTDNSEKGVHVDIGLGLDEFGFEVGGTFAFRHATAGTVEFTPTSDGVISLVISEEGFFSMEEKPSNITLSIAPK